ncbi:MAG: hypothetical protein ACXW1D_05000 [Halobacteriota archaeon]
MWEVSYRYSMKAVNRCYYQSRSEFYGLTPMQSAGRTLVELQGMIESSDLEHLMVHLAIGKLLQEEQTFDEETYDELLKHYEQKTALLNKEELETEDYNRLVSDLENIINTWK